MALAIPKTGPYMIAALVERDTKRTDDEGAPIMVREVALFDQESGNSEKVELGKSVNGEVEELVGRLALVSFSYGVYWNEGQGGKRFPKAVLKVTGAEPFTPREMYAAA